MPRACRTTELRAARTDHPSPILTGSDHRHLTLLLHTAAAAAATAPSAAPSPSFPPTAACSPLPATPFAEAHTPHSAHAAPPAATPAARPLPAAQTLAQPAATPAHPAGHVATGSPGRPAPPLAPWRGDGRAAPGLPLRRGCCLLLSNQ